MASKILKTVIMLLFFLFPCYSAQALKPLSIVINEIAWMGTINSANDEWIELYNNSDEDINLEGWGIYEQNGKVLIEPLTDTIKAKSYYLIERTDDETVTGIEASQKPSGWAGYGLKNSGEHLQLLDNNSNLIDEVNCKNKWFTGNNKTKQTMERINPSVSGNDYSNWQTSQNPDGTPKAENSQGETKLLEVSSRVESTAIPLTTFQENSQNKQNTQKVVRGINKKLTEQPYQELNKRKLPIFLIAFILAIFSGIMTLILKKKSSEKNSY